MIPVPSREHCQQAHSRRSSRSPSMGPHEAMTAAFAEMPSPPTAAVKQSIPKREKISLRVSLPKDRRTGSEADLAV